MKIITEFLKYFSYITTGILLIMTAVHIFDSSATVRMDDIVRIPLASAATAAITVPFTMHEPESKLGSILSVALHYVLLCITMTVIGMKLRWMSRSVQGVLVMCFMVALIYGFNFFITYFSSKHEADELNRALRDKGDK